MINWEGTLPVSGVCNWMPVKTIHKNILKAPIDFYVKRHILSCKNMASEGKTGN